MDKDTNLVPPLLIAAALVVLLGVVGNFDYADALVTDAIRKDPPKYFPASLVIPYSATVCQRSASPDKWKCKAYVSSTTRREIKR
jgi:hypothetical protein